MLALQLLFRASPAALLLVLCLQLGISGAQEDTTSGEAVIIHMEMPKTAAPNEPVSLLITVTTELKGCVAIKTYLVSSKPLDGPFNYKYTACLCQDDPRTFDWDFQSNTTVEITAVVDIVQELGICPEDVAVETVSESHFYATDTLYIQ